MNDESDVNRVRLHLVKPWDGRTYLLEEATPTKHEMTYGEAVLYCKFMTDGGFTNW
jgi:hypothetical protein